MKEAAKPYRNQRVSKPRQRRQQHLLEVSIRASKAREQRIRKAVGFCFKLILFVALLAGAWVGAREGIQRFFWENPRFYLTDVRVDTDGTLTREQILSAAAVQEGRNIFCTDLAGARSALDLLPQIERVELQRTLPNRIDILITERQPIAWIAARGDIDPSASDRSFLADARGYALKSRKVLPEYLHLPIISGVETEDLVAGQKVATFEMQAALELLRLNADSTRWQIREIDLAKGYCLVVTDQRNAQITFGLDNIDAQLSRLYRLLDHLQPNPQEIRTVNLLVERNTPVTFAEPEVAPAEVEAEAELSGLKPDGKLKTAPEIAKPRPEQKSSPVTGAPTKKVEPKEKTSATKKKKTNVDRLKKPFRM